LHNLGQLGPTIGIYEQEGVELKAHIEEEYYCFMVNPLTFLRPLNFNVNTR